MRPDRVQSLNQDRQEKQRLLYTPFREIEHVAHLPQGRFSPDRRLSRVKSLVMGHLPLVLFCVYNPCQSTSKYCRGRLGQLHTDERASQRVRRKIELQRKAQVISLAPEVENPCLTLPI